MDTIIEYALGIAIFTVLFAVGAGFFLFVMEILGLYKFDAEKLLKNLPGKGE